MSNGSVYVYVSMCLFMSNGSVYCGRWILVRLRSIVVAVAVIVVVVRVCDVVAAAVVAVAFRGN